MKTEPNSRRLDIVGNNGRSTQAIFSSVLKRWQKRFGYWSVFAAVPAVLASQLDVTRTVGATQPESRVTGLDTQLPRQLKLNSSSRPLLKRQSEFRLPHQDANDGNLKLGGFDDCPGREIPAGTYTAAAPFVDSGDTTGANNTINSAYFYCAYSNVSLPGPDHVYSFTISSLGPNAQLQISTSSSTYQPIAYLLSTDAQCPSGTGNHDPNNGCWLSPGFVWNLSSMPTNVPFYLVIDSLTNQAGSYTVRMQDVTIAPNCPLPNRVDCPGFFVSQHYRDFLNREPDAPGLAHWTNEITMCSDSGNRAPGETEAQCVDRKRTNTSGAFYLSNEFQNSANFLIRVNWGSLGKDRAVGRKCILGQHSTLDAVCRPHYWDYVSDLSNLTQGIVVNNELDPNRINTNKRNFVNQFVNRSGFLAEYPNSMLAPAFVDKLSQTTGIALTPQERSDLINKVLTQGRAAALFDMVDGTTTIAGGQLVFNTRYGQAYYDQEFNPAFVFAQYLSYLRRNPDQAGFDHWLAKLNFYGNFVDAEMVRAFIVSDEYRSRFGQP